MLKYYEYSQTDEKMARHHKGVDAAIKYLQQKGYEILSRSYIHWMNGKRYCIDIVAMDKKTDPNQLVFIDINVFNNAEGLPKLEKVSENIRELREQLAAHYVNVNPITYKDIPIRFDDISMEVISNNRAFVRHDINCLS